MEISAETRRVLQERARALAARGRSDAERGDVLSAVVFELNREQFAVECRFVREVCPVRNLLPLPTTPRHIAGVVAVRGEIVSLVDLNALLDFEGGNSAAGRVAVILADGRMVFGLLVDRVLQTAEFPAADVAPPPPTLGGLRVRFVRGVRDGRVTLLDGERLLNDPGLVVREEVPTVGDVYTPGGGGGFR